MNKSLKLSALGVLTVFTLASTGAAYAAQSEDDLIATVQEANSYLLDYAQLPPVVQAAQSKEADRIAK